MKFPKNSMIYRFIPLFQCMNIQIFEISSVETSIPGNQPVSLNLSVSSDYKITQYILVSTELIIRISPQLFDHVLWLFSFQLR